MPRKPRYSENLDKLPEVKTSFTDRFFKRIKESLEFFQPKAKSEDFENKLTGRIYELQKTVNEVIDQLHLIKTELSQELGDQELYELVEAIVDPLILNVERIRKKSLAGESEEMAYKRYTAWIDKAKIWVQIRSQSKEKDLITNTVIRHTIESFHEIVDRDLQVIQDYENHMLETLFQDEKTNRDQTIERVQRKLEPYLESLTMLKTRPKIHGIKELPEWKTKMNKLRETYFDGALHVIDEIVHDVLPLSKEIEEHDHLVGIFKRIADLEDALYGIKKEMDSADLSEVATKQIYLEQIRVYDEELLLLSANLHLTPELGDRIEALLNLVTKAQKYLG